MTGIVVDASAVVEILIGDGHLEPQLRAALSGREWHAPAYINTEVLSAIARKERAGDIEGDAATIAVGLWAKASVIRHDDPWLMVEAWRLRQSVRIADGFYLALARQLDVSLVTCDGRLARAPHPGVSVTLISRAGPQLSPDSPGDQRWSRSRNDAMNSSGVMASSG
jgi:predicted nucleic acid-binding protein